jgi:hypothetical protein
MRMKRCCTCKKEKPLREFYRAYRNPNGRPYRQYRCKGCSRDAAKKYRRDNPRVAKHFYRKGTLAKANATLSWYDSKLQEQGGGCAICGSTAIGNKSLSVDHDHISGNLRGLLCTLCNHAIERLESIQDWATKAQAYLDKYEQEYWRSVESMYESGLKSVGFKNLIQ